MLNQEVDRNRREESDGGDDKALLRSVRYGESSQVFDYLSDRFFWHNYKTVIFCISRFNGLVDILFRRLRLHFWVMGSCFCLKISKCYATVSESVSQCTLNKWEHSPRVYFIKTHIIV